MNVKKKKKEKTKSPTTHLFTAFPFFYTLSYRLS